jgi:hypothetical protein
MKKGVLLLLLMSLFAGTKAWANFTLKNYRSIIKPNLLALI